MEEPEGIKAIQGHSSGVEITDEKAQILPAGFVEHIYHATYLRNLQDIIVQGLLPGGRSGSKHRNQVFFSMVDWQWFDKSYTPEEAEFVECRKEPYFPRSDADCILEVNVAKLQELDLRPSQTESLAVVTRPGAFIPPECIDAAFNLKTGNLEWRREVARGDPELEHVRRETGASSSSSSSSKALPAQGDPQQDVEDRSLDEFVHCPQCRARLVRGTQFCDKCGASTDSEIVDDATKQMIEEESVQALFASVKLQWVKSKNYRGGESLSPDALFTQRCKDLRKRAIKGVTVGDVRVTYLGIADRFERDEQYRNRLREKDPSMGLAQAIHMDKIGMERMEGSEAAPMPWWQRREKFKDFKRIRSTQAGGSDMVAVEDHPDFRSVLRAREGRPSASGSCEKGKGKQQASAKGTGKEKGKATGRQAPYPSWSDDAWRDWRQNWWSSNRRW